MILTLAWKEIREHQAVWLTMVIMTVVLGAGLAKIVAWDDPGLAVAVAALTILGMSAAYGVVCGSMMFAGEHEGGTLVFLDIFLGRRGLLWAGKASIGIGLVLAQTFAVALIMRFLRQDSPGWIMALVGDPLADARPGRVMAADRNVWFVVLPVVALEAYAWGLLGSSLSQRVLAGATVAAMGATPVWLIAVIAPPEIFLGVRLVATAIIVALSFSNFLGQRQDAPAPPPPDTGGARDAKERFLDVWKEFEPGDDEADARPAIAEQDRGARAPTPAWIELKDNEPTQFDVVDERERTQPHSPATVLWWLTWQQARTPLCVLTAASLWIGLFLAANVSVLWPLTTLLIGVACGVMAFANEQRDLSYEFLAAQHFPLRMIWRFKTFIWLAVAILDALIIAFVYFGVLAFRQRAPGLHDGFDGSFARILGPVCFVSVWLLYGFAAGQLVVWLCRKTILALLISLLSAIMALGLWLPSMLCGAMAGWQLLFSPVLAVMATGVLVRAWAGGRIKERKPIAALAGFGAVAVLWALGHFAYRAWELPNVGAPIDTEAFRAALPIGKANAAARVIDQAVVLLDDENPQWRVVIRRLSDLPVGVLERPRLDGQPPVLKHLAACRDMVRSLGQESRQAPDAVSAADSLVAILALSRNLRGKAPLESYLAGVEAEEKALDCVTDLLTNRGKLPAPLLKRVLDELNRHAAETPPPLECVQSECARSSGLLANPNGWTLAAPGTEARIRQQWLAGSVAVSLELPWEAERKARLWQLVWAGLFRAVETPHWQLPKNVNELQTQKPATRKILNGWLPADETRLAREEIARLVDTSWLADERLFCDVMPLRAATRARWHVDAMRQAIALTLYRLEEGISAPDLQALVPKYLPPGLPMDPYSGERYRHRIEANGKSILWSTGPDGIDHNARNDGSRLDDADLRWARGEFDLVMGAPWWP